MHKLLASYTYDVYMYAGSVSRKGYQTISDLLDARKTKKAGCCLILGTYGGDPDAAYRIARALRCNYDCVHILIPDVCKSAGTLICIGADKLIFGDRGELGPLDVQLSKPDEMFESMSGLDLIQALAAIEAKVLSSFRKYLLDIRNGSRLRTKMAADIAAKLTEDFMAPITAKIDPVTLGEHQRAMQIGFDYGQRLNAMSKNLKNGALERLVAEYPSHGFVIDRKEARELFVNVERPDPASQKLVDWTRGLLEKAQSSGSLLVVDLAETFSQKNPNECPQSEATKCDEGVPGSTESPGSAVPESVPNNPATGTSVVEGNQASAGDPAAPESPSA